MSLELTNETILDEKYLVIRKLGEGGFGQVYLAQDILIEDRHIALKYLKINEPDREKFLIREMEFLSSLSHPNIVQFYHHFREKEDLFLAIEYCPGGSLRQRLQIEGHIKLDQAVAWMNELCGTLQLVHDNGIVHDDLKPENFLFSADKKIKIADFGVANTRTGTLYYMAPEQFLPSENVSRLDVRVDIYALGMTFLEMLVGENPFFDLSDEEMLNIKVRQNFISNEIPDWLKEIFLKALHPKPELRFQTMREFQEAIESKHVPYVFSQKRIQAHNAASKAEGYLKRRKWVKALKLANQALNHDSKCLNALIIAGKCELTLRRIQKAEQMFERALKLNPRVNIQKDLGWVYLEQGRFPEAISVLNDHLYREASDYEAYNLLIKAFYKTNRYEAAIELMKIILKEFKKNNCFENNLHICHMILGDQPDEFPPIRDGRNPFLIYNWGVFREKTASWNKDNREVLKSKLLFQEYRFGENKKRKPNTLIIEYDGDKKFQFEDPIVSIGRNSENNLVLDETIVSRRHCLLINYTDDIWIYDLGSTHGTIVDDELLKSPLFLDGRHHLKIGVYDFSILTKEGILL